MYVSLVPGVSCTAVSPIDHSCLCVWAGQISSAGTGKGGKMGLEGKIGRQVVLGERQALWLGANWALESIQSIPVSSSLQWYQIIFIGSSFTPIRGIRVLFSSTGFPRGPSSGQSNHMKPPTRPVTNPDKPQPQSPQ